MEDKTYLLITGASSGIGREIAIQLSVNYKLILGGRDKIRLMETQNLCEKKIIILFGNMTCRL